MGKFLSPTGARLRTRRRRQERAKVREFRARLEVPALELKNEGPITPKRGFFGRLSTKLMDILDLGDK